MSDTQTPFFTIGIPAYNAASTIAETVEAVLAQTWTDWELVIVDDGSSDRTFEFASAYAASDPRIRVLRADHKGCGAARDLAFTGSRARYLCRLDADDLYLPGYLSTMREAALAHPDVQVFSCNAEKLYADGRTELLLAAPRWSQEASVTFDEMVDHNPIFQMTVIDRETYWAVGGTRSGVVVEDYDFWLRALLHGARHLYLPVVLGRYRVHGAQASADNARMLRSRIDVLDELSRRSELTPERAAHVRRAAAVSRKRLLEQMVRDGRPDGILELYRAARPAYGSRAKYVLGLVAGLVDERLLARLVAGRSRGR